MTLLLLFLFFTTYYTKDFANLNKNKCKVFLKLTDINIQKKEEKKKQKEVVRYGIEN